MRGRKTEIIKRVTKRDGEMMKCIARTSLITKNNAKTYFNLNDKRLKQLEKSKMIYKDNVLTKSGIQNIYRINSQGRNWIKNNTDIDYFQKSDNTQVQHDLALSQYYCQTDENIRARWINETTIQREWNNLSTLERSGAVDAMTSIKDERGIETRICIEVITSNYAEQDMQEKIEVAEKLNAEIVFIKA